MLNHVLLMKEFQILKDQLFADFSHEYDIARAAWQRIVEDPLFVHKVKAASAPWPTPSWQGKLDQLFPIKPISKYTVISVDGSQIYPDRHQGASCFLVNIGTVHLSYGGTHKPVHFDSIPHLFTGHEQAEDMGPVSVDLVNCRRQELEFLGGYETARVAKEQLGDEPLVLLFDGSLIFWHLESKNADLKDQFLSRYCALLFGMYRQKIVNASYISLPRSRELANLIGLELCDFDANKSDRYKTIEHVGDMQVARFFLEPHTRSIVFQNHADVTESYPDEVKPYFFYIDVGDEIGRVEIPAWVARDEALVDLVAQVVVDQSEKGRGYPVALAEAHEQAVVKGPDRDLFYHLLAKVGIENKRVMTHSQKSIKKRGMGI